MIPEDVLCLLKAYRQLHFGTVILQLMQLLLDIAADC